MVNCLADRQGRRSMSTTAGVGSAATRTAVDAYFKALKAKGDWRSLLAEDIAFTSRTSPVRRIDGRAAFLEETKRFYSTIGVVDVRQVIVEGNHACALTRYTLQPPAGTAFESDVAEIFTVRDGKIATFDIFFDSAPYPK